jgi:hypothetical protein
VTGARRQLILLATTSEDLVRHTAGDSLGACESVAELVVRAVRRVLLVQFAALRRASAQLEARGLERGLSVRLDDFARPVERELRSITVQCAACQGMSQIHPAAYRAALAAVAHSLQALVARPDVVMFLEEGRRRTDWPRVAVACQRLWEVTQLRIDVDAAWLPHQLAERVATLAQHLARECARKASRAGLAAAMLPAEAVGAVVPIEPAGGSTLIVVPPDMPDPAVAMTGYVHANPGISTTALRRCLALHPEQLRRTLHQLIDARLISVENRAQSGADAEGARDKVCFATETSSRSAVEPGRPVRSTARAQPPADCPEAASTP